MALVAKNFFGKMVEYKMKKKNKDNCETLRFTSNHNNLRRWKSLNHDLY